MERKKILYIEDDPVALSHVGKLIEKMGHRLIPAANSEEGFRKVVAERPDVVLMDIFLPGLDGYETAMRIRSNEDVKNIPIVALTGQMTPADRQMAYVLGFDGYLTKPVDFAQLENNLRDLLEKRHENGTAFGPQEENIELKRFIQRLVQRLTDKIDELSDTNHKLDIILREARANNADILKFNFVSNQVLAYSERERLYKELPSIMCRKLSMTSAAIYVINQDELTLDLFSHQNVVPRPEIQRISFLESPFFDMVYHQEPCLIDAYWMQAALRQGEAIVRQVDPLLESFLSPNIYFLPIVGRPKFEHEFDCTEQECHAVINKDKNWWNRQINQLDRESLYYETQLKQISRFYFDCCMYNLKGILAIGMPEERLDENLRQIIQSFVRTAGLSIENIQLYDDAREAYLLAEKQAITDGLTEIYNFRYFHYQLEREIKRSKRHWYKTSLIMIDIDNFKQYNDTNGHPAGDEVLKRIADTLRSNTRTSDIVARYGGEEFVLILPETPKSAAVKLAEKIRANVAQQTFFRGSTQPAGSITVSLGVACFPDDAQNTEDLVQRADEQLYRAKQSGKNRVAYGA
jgi:diguanylate cyclase (GGDEF)-like protein